ncbi:MAG: 50S ribosomal protein L21 [Candidatus Kerfeldbacteria bacterium]|nr:50S ribosomal protein L21 [Candidatus Kerfeldbacteria bacterium]
MLAIVKTGGKQYLVHNQDTITIETIAGAVGDAVMFDQVLLVADDAGNKLQLGKPTVVGTKVPATIAKQDRHDKVITVKFHNKTRYRRRKGHRQPFTQVTIGDIK